jgi:Flp pilus assembly protein TadB
MMDSVSWLERIAAFGLTVVVFQIVWLLLPPITCRLDARLASVQRTNRRFQPDSRHKGIPQPLLTWCKLRLIRGGFRQGVHLDHYLAALLLPGPVLFFLALLTGQHSGRAFLLGLLASHLVNEWLTRRISARRRVFQQSLYKIYRFLDLQLTAGVKALDVLKGLADAIDQPLIKPDFQRFCAKLELTLDLDGSLAELETAFNGPDMNLLASQLRNSLQTGIIGQAFLRMENLLFNRHLALMQAQSKQIRTGLLLVGLLALVPIEVLFAYPLVGQAAEAFAQLFGP